MAEDSAKLNRKRAAQLARVTKLHNAADVFDVKTQHINVLADVKAQLLTAFEAHAKLIDQLIDCDDADDAKIIEDEEKFRVAYCSALCAVEDKLVPRKTSADEVDALSFQIGEFAQFKANYNEESVSVSELKNRLDFLKPLHKSYIDAFNEFYKNADEDDKAGLVDQRQTFTTAYFKVLGWFSEEIARRAPEPIASTSIATKVSSLPEVAKLPRLPLPTYDGSPDTWVEFRDSFKSMVHDLTSISGALKMRYLKSAITDKHSPISHLLESDDGYANAWKMVLEYYDDERRILDGHFNGMLRAKHMTCESHDELQRLLKEFNTHTAAVDRMHTEQKLYQALIAHLVIFRLDARTRDLWETENKGKIPLWPDLQKFLSERRKTLSTMPALKATGKSTQGSQSNKPNTTAQKSSGYKTSNVHSASKATDTQQLKASSSSQLTYKCPMCSADHRLFQCLQFINLSIPHRLSKVKDLKLCSNCFGSHTIDSCTSKFRCRTCKQMHHTMLHQEAAAANTHSLHADAEPFLFRSCNSATSSGKRVAMMQTANVKVQSDSGEWLDARAFLDSGSDSNYIAKRVVDALNLKTHRTYVVANGLGGVEAAVIKQKVYAMIGNGDETFAEPVKFLVTAKVTNPMPSAPIDCRAVGIPADFVLADPKFHVPGRIDMLIGNNLYGKLMRDGRFVLPSGPVMLKSMFGWVLTGNAPQADTHESPKTTQCNISTLSDLNQTLERFYKLEDYRNDRRFFTDEEIHCEEVFEQTYQRLPTGRFIVTIPFKENVNQLVNNFSSTLNQFLSNEKRLQKNEPLKEKYVQFMREYEELGHMTEVDISKDSHSAPAYYFPHHAVEKPESSTTSVRIVFNGSSKTASGLSLNDTQCVGPQIQSDAFTLTLRFRQHAIVIKADIAKMYRQVLVAEHQRCYQRIIWRDNPESKIRVYSLNTVTYGTASASFESTRCLKQLAIDNKEKFPKAAEEVLSSFYVDDLISGSDTVHNAVALTKDIVRIIDSAEMKLRKFNSNSTEFLSHIPEEDREAAKEETSIKALGIKWDPSTDMISFDVRSIEHDKITRRIVLSEVAKIYDPEGLLGPVIFRFKLFLKTVNRLSLPWDTILPEKESNDWKEIASTFEELRNIRIRRHFLISNHVQVQLHGFCDASELGYGAAIYLVSTDARGRRESHLVCSKSRISPAEYRSIARLELCGAVVLSVLMMQVSKALTIKINRMFCWSDSAIVLHWLRKLPSQLQTFVANRVSEIQETMMHMTWRHIRGIINPADLISRGLTATEIVDCTLWWHGPEFLLLPEQEWPSSIVEIDPNEPFYVSEFKKIATLATQLTSSNIFLKMTEDSSRLWALKKKIAPMMRFIFNCRASKKNMQRRTGPIQVADLLDAEIALVRIHQRNHFHDDFRRLSDGKPAAANSSIKNLNPQWDAQHKVIRVGGRLSNAEDCSGDQKHPIILPNCHLTKMMIREVHEKNLHAGQKATLAIVRLRYWPIRAPCIIKAVLHKCVTCFRARPKLIQQFMGSLPTKRVTPAPPFYHTGVDYCGPFDIKLSSIRSARMTKAYVALFVCLTTKAIHLEVVSDLTTQAFLAAFDRFTSCRGLVHSMHSDNGLNFVGANNTLRELFTFLEKSTTQSEILEYFKSQEIEWFFIPPRAPEHGGLWEAGVKSMKYHLHRVAQTANLNFEEFYTLMKKIEAILNSRPLTAISDDPNDFSFLTAGHFLIGRPLVAKADRDLTNTPISHLKRWDRLLHMQQHFWRRWSQEYLHQLQIRTKNYKDEIPVKIGQLVLLHVDNTPTMHWPIGRIISIFPGKDKITRVARIRTSKSTYERPVNKLAILPIDPTDDQLVPPEDVRV